MYIAGSPLPARPTILLLFIRFPTTAQIAQIHPIISVKARPRSFILIFIVHACLIRQRGSSAFFQGTFFNRKRQKEIAQLLNTPYELCDTINDP